MFYHVWDVPIFCCIGGRREKGAARESVSCVSCVGGVVSVGLSAAAGGRCSVPRSPSLHPPPTTTSHPLPAPRVPPPCAGALGGLLGALFIHLNVRITQLRHRHIPFRSPWKRLAEVVVLSFVTASLWFALAWSSPCSPLPSPVSVWGGEGCQEVVGRWRCGEGAADEWQMSACPTVLHCAVPRGTAWYRPQDDLRYLEADEDQDLDFLSGGGDTPAGGGLAHFPQLWCPNGTYSARGQLFLVPLSQVGGQAGALRWLLDSWRSLLLLLGRHPSWLH